MSDETILTEYDSGVITITLNRPDKLNAMNRVMMLEIQQFLRSVEADETIGCIISPAPAVPSRPAETFTSSVSTTGAIHTKSSTECERTRRCSTSAPAKSRQSA